MDNMDNLDEDGALPPEFDGSGLATNAAFDDADDIPSTLSTR